MNHEARDVLERNFGKHVNLTEEVHKFLYERFKSKTFAPREMIVEGGAVAQYFYLVLSGVQMIYLISESGEKVVLGFSFYGNISGVYDSFITQKPSTLFFRGLDAFKDDRR